MKIRITSVPAGGAPEQIRKDWVGVEMPLDLGLTELTHLGEAWNLPGINPGTRQPTTGGENRGGYSVATQTAIDCLRKAGKAEAADYWQQYLDETGADVLAFGRQFCEVVEG